jgi:hypothetical protein
MNLNDIAMAQLAIAGKFCRRGRFPTGGYPVHIMKKKVIATKRRVPAVPQNRSFRRLIRKMFTSVLKRQRGECHAMYQKAVLDKLRDIEDSIEIIAREIARQARLS